MWPLGLSLFPLARDLSPSHVIEELGLCSVSGQITLLRLLILTGTNYRVLNGLVFGQY